MSDNKNTITGEPILAVAHPVNDNDQGAGVIPIAVPAQSIPSTGTAVPIPITETYSDNLPIAPSLHRYSDNSPEAQEHAMAQQTRIGSDIGKINTMGEREHIRRSNERSRTQTQMDEHRVLQAQRMAMQRVSEGTDVKEDLYFNKEEFMQSAIKKKVKEQEDLLKSTGASKRGEGYEVKDYEIAEYNGDEYSDTYEYKSIYD
jgi:hypothetical protein